MFKFFLDWINAEEYAFLPSKQSFVKKLNIIYLSGFILMFSSLFCYAAWDKTKPANDGYLVNGPSEIRANFDAIEAGTTPALQVTNEKVSATAGIADTKLAQITTASKVSGTALTGLASVPVGAGALPVANGGTGATSASAARTSLGAAASGANSDITSLTGLTTALAINKGGTGSTTQNFVGLTGNQTVAGVKTFSSSPIVPTPTTDMQAATKKSVEDFTPATPTANKGLRLDGAGKIPAVDGSQITNLPTDDQAKSGFCFGASFVEVFKGADGTYGIMKSAVFVKVAGLDYIKVHLLEKIAASGTVYLRLTCDALTGAGNAYTNSTGYAETDIYLDVSSLTDGTQYTVNLEGGNSVASGIYAKQVIFEHS